MLWWTCTGGALSNVILWYAKKLNEFPASFGPAKNIQKIFGDIAAIDRSVRVTHVRRLAQKVPSVIQDIGRCLARTEDLAGIERDDNLWFTETSSVCMGHCIIFLEQLLPKVGLSLSLEPGLQASLHNKIMATNYCLVEKPK